MKKIKNKKTYTLGLADTSPITKEELEIFEKFVGRNFGKSFGDETNVILRVLGLLNGIKKELK